jgi:antitoxin component YwqK of YwqJK toxin-antitoxin module
VSDNIYVIESSDGSFIYLISLEYYIKIVFEDGKIKSEGCIIKGLRQGIWKDYANYDDKHYVRFLWTYKNDIKDGPYQALGETGIIEAKGQYKLGLLSDTLKSYNDNGELTNYSIYKPNKTNGSSSPIYTKILIKPEHPDGYRETINGKTYSWASGRRYEIKIASSDAVEKIKKSKNVTLTIPWEDYDKSSIITITKITFSNLNGYWKTTQGVYKDGVYNQPINFTTPIILEFNDNTVKRSKNGTFIKYTLLNNVITIKGDQTESGIINKITSTELIITWRKNGSYTRYFYTRQ